jgi:siroheme synthase-like protein
MSYPVVLQLQDVAVLVVGGGPVAARKVEGLLAAGARVTVVAPEIDPSVVGATRVERRPYRRGDIDGHRLVVTATGDQDVDARVSADARAAGVWVNAADDPAQCTFVLPAVLRRGPVTVAVGTGGASPALARRLRDEIAEVVGEEVAIAAELLAAQRAEVHARGGSTEAIDWAPIIDAALAAARLATA